MKVWRLLQIILEVAEICKGHPLGEASVFLDIYV
jgi:hypothetical protein